MWKTIFRVLDKNNLPTDAEINKISPFLFCKWLGNNPNTVLASNQLNLNYHIPMLNQYKMINAAFGGKKLYISYPKNTKDNTADNEILAKHFKINTDKAQEYREFLAEEEINSIIKMYNEL